MLAFPNRIDQSSLSGGSWVGTLPLANLKNRLLGKVARSTGLALASTRFDIDLGAARVSRVFQLVRHNLSMGARYRLRGSRVADFSTTVYDSGAAFSDVWPEVYPFGTLEWEDDSWWSRRYAAEEIDGYTPTLTVVMPANVLAQYWRVEIDDASNPAGYAQIGRVFIGPAWQPTINIIYGASVKWVARSEVQEARSGAEYFDRRVPYRESAFTLSHMEQDEAFSQAFELQRRAGIDMEVVWIHDPDDTVHAIRRQYLGRMRELSAIEYPEFNLNSAAFVHKEII
ncbi:hypothetical protein GTP38_23350 [Duganella sp. FT94W]|uniref:Uncharacterized protein n=1 Tax=Duganella lactea TaxID=2692173 RepID=A0ABW9VEU1_9BURK|nr:hypothetical protein [Duganella lactea]MYM37267.1 hypothetical protein [Duganella lactea]